MLTLAGNLQAQRLHFRSYTVMDGLVANPVRCIYQDSEGFIWIGTFEGLSRYNGYKFTNYTTSNGLSHNFVNSLFEIGGKLLVAENNGVVDIVQNRAIRKNYLLQSGVNAINLYRQRVLLSTDTSGFYEYKNDSMVHAVQERTGTPLGSSVTVYDSLLLSVAVDRDIFVFTNDLRVYATSKSQGVHYYSVFNDSKNRTWACSSTGLKLLEIPARKNQPLKVLPLPAEFNFSPLNNTQVTSMIEKDGSYWIGTSKGLVQLSPGKGHRVFDKNDGLPSDFIQTIYQDREENLWIGTSLGLAKWVSRNSVLHFDDQYKGYKSDVSKIYPLNENDLLVTTSQGVQYFQQPSNSFHDIEGGQHAATRTISNTSPALVHYPGYIGFFDSEKKHIRPLIKLDTMVTDVHSALRHPSGLIFLASGYGLFVINKNRVRKILPYRVTSMDFDSTGFTWVGTWGNGIFRLKQLALSDSLAFEIDDLTATIQQKEIRSLYCESLKSVWIGTRYGGVFNLTINPRSGYKAQQFNRQSGLFSDWVKCIAAAGNGDIWIGSYLGLDRLVKESGGYRIFNFSKAVNFFAQVEQVVASGNHEWLCVTNTGIARFKDEQLHRSPPLQPYITWSPLGSSKDKVIPDTAARVIRLQHHQNALRFEFSAPGFINEKQVLYSYRLAGSGDTNWTNPENIHEAAYASLAPGQYVFEVRTMGWNGKSGAITSLAFTITPPFWKTTWFYALCIFCIALALYGIYRYRITQLLKWQRIRDRIAADLHDDIGSSLTNISILSELSYKNLHQPQQAEQFLQRITEQIHDSSQAMDDIIWSVNSKNDSVEETFARMRRFAAELFDNTDIEYSLSFDEEICYRKINMEQRRDIFLLYKEVLNNIYKHAAATSVKIAVAVDRNLLLMHIQDNGVGFKPKVVSHRNGLKNLYQRSAKWGGTINIQSAPGEGAEIKISIPI